MTGLAAQRRWINISKLDQSVYNSKQGAYQTVVPGSFIEGGHVAEDVKNCPWFRETTAHFTTKEIYPLIQEETDINLLKTMVVAEQYTGRREGIVKMFDMRIKVLTKELEANHGNTVNAAHN